MTKKRKKNKHTKTKSTVVVLLLALVGGLWSMMRQSPQQFAAPHLQSRESSTSSLAEPEDSPNPLSHIDKAEIAKTPHGTPSQILRRTGYIVSYNKEWKQPNWVGYELTTEELEGSASRRSNFEEDPDVEGRKVDTRDYTRSGYDRGHMAPAGDMKWSETTMSESFLMSNVCPQAHELNRGRWKELEELIREWSYRDGSLLITCGPIVPEHPQTIGRSKVAVPDRFFKVVAAPYLDRPKAIGFIFENNDDRQPSLRELAIPVDSVERVTGIDFFYNLPDPIENEIERNLSIRSWKLN